MVGEAIDGPITHPHSPVAYLNKDLGSFYCRVIKAFKSNCSFDEGVRGEGRKKIGRKRKIVTGMRGQRKFLKHKAMFKTTFKSKTTVTSEY